MKYIYHHLGLGDHFICNGLVRHYHSIHGQITLFCKTSLKPNIDFMYRDLENFIILGLSNDTEVLNYINSNNLKKDLIQIGFDKLKPIRQKAQTFDKAFYLAENVDFSYRFEKFYIQRDLQREKQLYDKLITFDQYIFVHDDKDRGMYLWTDKIKSNLPIVKNDKNYLITDYLTILENASEIHVMQSCFKDMINSYKLIKPKIFLHNYVRRYDDYANSVGLNHFEVIE